ncbi:MAG TPA: hypothetical protein VFF37_06380 [Streptomyces sp.]|nr:hypothetical protein [Streptomyces sp.]
MQNNRIFVDSQLLDASALTDQQWARLVTANRDSVKRRLVKCAWCWQEDHTAHWMKTYSKTDGTRVVSHQAGESGDHPYQALESDEHRATCDRVERIWIHEGGTAIREALAADGKTRSDVLLIGSRTVSYEMQHSPFKPGYGATERTRRALAAGRDSVAWHTDSEGIARGAQVAMLRSNRATLPQIENPRYELRMLGGYRKGLVWTCTAREGYRCPDGRFSGCGKRHFGTEPAALTLDDFTRWAPVGLIVPVMPLDRRGFWTTADGYELWLEHAKQDDRLQAGESAGARKTRHRADGHSLRRSRVPTDAAGLPIPPCRFCGEPASMSGPEGKPEHWSCRRQQESAA